MPKQQSYFSLDTFAVPVEVLIPEGTNPQVTKDTLQWQFVLGGLPIRAQPTETGWSDGYWLRRTNGILLAAIDVGPGGLVLPRGKYAAWLSIFDDPTNPIGPVDQLLVY